MQIRDVAKRLKLSVATVSRALNPETAHLVAEKTRRKVEDFVREVGYVPNRTARELSWGKTKTIGVVTPNVLPSIFFNDYLIKLLAGVYKVLEEDNTYNCKIMILPQGKVVEQLQSHVLSSGIDGLLLSPYCDHELYGKNFPKNLLATWNHPTVLLSLKPDGASKFSCVYVDHEEAAYKAVTYLIQKGHKDIGMIQGSDTFPEAVQRYDGYARAMNDHGLKIKKEWIVPGNFLMEGGYAGTLALIKKNQDRPTALFCANDETAIGALRALKTLGIRCPQDMAVMGFDGLELGEYLDPKLTSVFQPTRLMGETATKLLLDLINGREPGPTTRVIPTQILVRESA